MGDVVKGPLVTQCARRGNLHVANEHDHQLVKQLVAEVCGSPAMLTEERKQQFLDKYGQDGYDQIPSMIAFMEWLNFTMGAAGMRLESRMLPFAEAVTKNRKLPFNLRSAVKDDHEEDIGMGEVVNVRRSRGMLGMFTEHMKNMWGLLGLIVPVASASLSEKRWFGGIPNTVEELDD